MCLVISFLPPTLNDFYFQTRLAEGEDQFVVKLDDPILRKAFCSSSSTSTGGAFRLKMEVPPQYQNIFNLDNSVVDGGSTENVSLDHMKNRGMIIFAPWNLSFV